MDRVERTEIVVPGPAEGLAGLLGVTLPDLEAEGLPALWHWVYLLDRPAQVDLGADGHPVRGVVPVPPGPGLRRMWAGGAVRTRGPLVVGQEATRTSEVARTEDKVGRTGAMTFVTVRHTIRQRGLVVVEEDQHIVYRQPPSPAAPPAIAPTTTGHVTPGSATTGPAAPAPAPRESSASTAGGEDWVLDVTPTLLARFSALTYNGHRIHYDREFTRDVEGYPGLLVHGPLQAVAMAEAARRLAGGRVRPVTFDYRLVAPLFDHEGMVVSAHAVGAVTHTTVRDRAGRQTATGVVTADD